MEKTIKVREYSEYPGPRYVEQGEFSGEDFYHTILNKAFTEAYKDNSVLNVDLDNTAGYMSSFLDEAFGNLVYDFSKDIVEKHLHVISDQEPDWIAMLHNESFLQWEQRRLKQEKPKKTVSHPQWYKLINDKLECQIG